MFPECAFTVKLIRGLPDPGTRDPPGRPLAYSDLNSNAKINRWERQLSRLAEEKSEPEARQTSIVRSFAYRIEIIRGFSSFRPRVRIPKNIAGTSQNTLATS